MTIELNKSSRSVSRESKVYEIGRDVVAAKKQNKGPDIWLAGDPADWKNGCLLVLLVL